MDIRKIAMTGALAALLSPLAALAQEPPPPGGMPPPGPPPPEVRAQMEQLRTQYKTAAFNDLSADHRAKVQAILAQVQSGSLDRRDAATQIDNILSPNESQAVLGEAQKMHEAMRKSMGDVPPPPDHRGMMNRKPDAGRFLLMISMPPPMMMQPPAQP